jgi:hypothetical protein
VKEDTQMDFFTWESKELFNYLLLESLWMFYAMIHSFRNCWDCRESRKFSTFKNFLQRRKSFPLVNKNSLTHRQSKLLSID